MHPEIFSIASNRAVLLAELYGNGRAIPAALAVQVLSVSWLMRNGSPPTVTLAAGSLVDDINAHELKAVHARKTTTLALCFMRDWIQRSGTEP